MSRRFELLRGGVALGVVALDATASDFPWFVGWLEPTPAYAAVAPLFDAVSRLSDAEDVSAEADDLHDQILAPGVQMRSLPDGEETEVVGLAIDGCRVSWRI